MEKQALRSLYKNLRQSLSKQEFDNRQQQVFQGLTSFLQAHPRIKNIHSFISIERFNEIQIEKFWTADFQFIVPKTDFANRNMSHYYVNENLVLDKSSYGILEPSAGDLASIDAIDLVLVPLLAYDQNKMRVGYGKGFYDGFIAQLPPTCITLGLSLFPPEKNAIQGIEAHDRALDFVLSPSGLI
ncbi:MAG: 5-formyltetrahydrofolate cyclo-ligase [Flavobacteriaceae bacterium]